MKRTAKHDNKTRRLGLRSGVQIAVALAALGVLGAFGAGSPLAMGSESQSEESSNPNPSVDREYVLEAFLSGYVGLEGEIEGQTNPVLTAAAGETVRITIVNGEAMPHDIVMEQHGDSSEVVRARGAETAVTFTAETDDVYFCSIGGHRQAGMEGEFRLE